MSNVAKKNPAADPQVASERGYSNHSNKEKSTDADYSMDHALNHDRAHTQREPKAPLK